MLYRYLRSLRHIKKPFRFSKEEALGLAKATKGYALAYQILGDILFRTKKTKIDSSVLEEYDLKLSDWSYQIIWSELSKVEKRILTLVSDGFVSNQSLMEKTGMSKGNLAIYKKKLVDEGLLSSSVRGQTSFLLPRFENFIQFLKMMEEA